MKSRKLITAVICLVLVSIMIFSSCGKATTASSTTSTADASTSTTASSDSDWNYILSKGTLVMGVTYFEPICYKASDGTLVGFDTELSKAVCDKLGITPVYQEIDWDSKEAELNAKTIDCVWNGFTVTEDRRENFDFTDYYMVNKQVAVVKTSKASTYSTLDAMSGAVMGAEADSAGDEFIKANATLSKNDFVSCQAQSNVLLELEAGTIDIGVIDSVMASAMLKSSSSTYTDLSILNLDLSDPEYYAVGFRKGSDAVAKINEAMAELKADGTLAKIAEKYGLTDAISFSA